MKNNKVLFIWPPFVTSRWIPLGIPFLVAYLRNNGIRDIDVFDMNTAYAKEKQPSWFFYGLIKKGCEVFMKNIKTDEKNGRWVEYLFRKKNEVLDSLWDRERRCVPWSLNSILSTFFKDDLFQEMRNSVRRLLAPWSDPGGISMICISVNYPEQLFFSFLIADEIRKRSGGSVDIVLGGAQVIKHIDHLKKSRQVCDLFDFLITEDGEEPILKLLEARAEKNFSDVPNLYYRDPDHRGEFVSSRTIFFLDPVHFSVPDFSGFDLDDYENTVPLIITKGCLWGRCTFCSYSNAQKRRFCSGTAEKAIFLIKAMRERYSATDFFFVDDALPPRFMEELAKALLRENIGITWGCNIILHQAFKDLDFCRLLKKAGCDGVLIGLESVAPRVLSTMNKYHCRMEAPEMREILRGLKKAGIRVQLNIIFGFPGETLDEARQTLRFLLDFRDLYDSVVVQPFCLEDQTLVAQSPEKFGILKIDKDDKNAGKRLGYRFEVKEGLSQGEALRFAGDAARVLTRALKR